MKTIFCFLILLLAIAPSSAKYDYFKLVQQWPPAACYQPPKQCTKHPKDFTIHGLWPELWPAADKSNSYLQNCPSTTKFTSTLVKSLFPRINTSWPNLFGENGEFWGHEWVAHGTCSESTFKVLDYFKLALDIKDRVHILKAFKDNGIRHSHSATYGYKQVVSAIQKHLGHPKQGEVAPKVELRCRGSKSGAAGVYLHEVGLCLDRSGKAFISCPPSNNQAVRLCQSTESFKLLPP